MSERPWNTPQGWENGLPSGMMDQYGSRQPGSPISLPRAVYSSGPLSDPARRRQEAVQAHIMGLNGDLAHDLLLERHAAGGPAQFPQQLVVVSLAPAQPATVQVKGHPGNQN